MSKPDFTRARWVKSNFSEPNGNCVELAAVDGLIGMRDSKLGDASPILILTPDELRALLDGAQEPRVRLTARQR